jgi:transcriptional regulator with GAF, ATPase, and Fis domain
MDQRPTEIQKRRRVFPKLIIRENGGERLVELTHKVTTIGRSHENVVEIDDINSSRRHCHIERKEDGYEIVDLKSRNGTLVNGILVLRKELRPGDCIEIGKTRMYFERISTTLVDDTIDLNTDYFLEPLSGLEEESQLAVLKKEREIFLKLLEINRNLNSRLVLGDLLDLILDTVVEVTGAERGFLILREGNEVAVKAARNMDREKIKDPEFKVSQSIAVAVMESGEAIRSENAVKDARFSSFASVAKLNMKSVLCAPIRGRDAGSSPRAPFSPTATTITEGKSSRAQAATGVMTVRGSAPAANPLKPQRLDPGVIGVIYVDNRFEPSGFTENHLRWLEILSHQAAVAIQNARLFEENRRRQEELEEARARLERSNLELEEKVISKSLQLEEAIRLIPKERPVRFKYKYDAIITRSPKMFDIFGLLDKVTDSNVPILVLGESGTGKELVARAIHQNGPRAGKQFVSENCAAIPVNLLESEFFGHERGSFTGATRDKRGLFEVAHEGTLFLDEIADMPPEMQTKFLRVLQEGEFRRVGGKEIIRVNVRVISATNKNIYDLVRQGKFREDLLYRINVITVTLPPLRERREDIPILIDFFLDRIAKRGSDKKKTLDRETFHLLYQYDWPGNIRELENEVERLSALSGERIEANLLSANILSRGKKSTPALEGKTLKEIVARTVEDVEMQVIQVTLIDNNWKKAKTAEILGISRPTLDSKIEKYRLSREGALVLGVASGSGNGGADGDGEEDEGYPPGGRVGGEGAAEEGGGIEGGGGASQQEEEHSTSSEADAGDGEAGIRD